MSQQWSPDGAHWWDGTAWRQASPDKKHYFDGTSWQPIPGEPASGEPASNVNVAVSKPKKRGGGLKWLAGIIGLLLLLGVCSAIVISNSSTPSKSSSSSTAEATLTPKSSQAANPAPSASSAKPPTTAASSTGRDGSCAPQPCANDSYGWIVTVSNVKYDAKSDNPFDQPEAGNVFVTMQINFTNKLGTAQHTNPFDFTLVDGAGVKHRLTFSTVCQTWEAVDVAPGGTYGPKCLAFQAVAGKPSGLILVWTPKALGGDYQIKLS